MPWRGGVGGSGPALTHTASQYPPAQLTAVLKAPTAKMKAAGMVPLTVNAADMEALVSYVSSLGGTPAASGATPPAAGSSSSASAKRNHPQQPHHRKHQPEIRQAMQPPSEGRAFLILKAVVDVTGRPGWRHWASAVSSSKSVFASSNGSSSERYNGRSESAHCQDESCRHGPADFERC